MDLAAIATELTAGTVGGCMGVIVGHPMDRVKVIMQAASTSKPIPSSAWGISNHIFRTEGPLALFRGLLTPLLAAAPQNAQLFATYSAVLAWMDSAGWTAPQLAPSAPTPDPSLFPAVSSGGMVRHMAAGAVSGAGAALILAPAELAKCMMQVDMGRKAAYTSSLTCLRDRVSRFGVVRGAYQGLAATLSREVVGFQLYFGVYQLARAALVPFWAPDAREGARMVHSVQITGDPSWAVLLAGGMAGVVSWGVIFPIDAIKTRIQTAPAPMTQWAALQQARGEAAGLAGLYRGVGVCLARGFVVNAVTFYVYERTLDVIKGLA